MRKFFDPVRIFEVRSLQPLHILARDAETFARDIDIAYSRLSGFGIADVGKIQRDKFAVLNADHSPATTTNQKSDGGVAELTAICHIERYRVATTQFIPDIFMADRQSDAALFEAACELDFDFARQVDLGKTDVSMVIDFDVHELFHIGRIELFNEALGEDRNTVMTMHGATLDDRSFDDVADAGERNCLLLDVFTDQGQRRSRGFTDAQREMSGLTTHGDDDIPAMCCARVFHKVLHQLDADVASGLKPESRDMRRQRQIIINRLWDVNGEYARMGGDRTRRERRIVAANGHQMCYSQSIERLDDRPHRFFRLGWIFTGGPEHRAAIKMKARDIIDG